jgi:hypothetical protein
MADPERDDPRLVAHQVESSPSSTARWNLATSSTRLSSRQSESRWGAAALADLPTNRT